MSSGDAGRIGSSVPEIRVIIGPTASGKSAIAMELARRFDVAIISADSRQVYRGFDIGTAKPSVRDRNEVVHYGVDVQDPRDRYSAHAWAIDTLGWIQQANTLGKYPLIVGGTGFYVRALTRPLAPVPILDATRRRALSVWLSQQPLSELQRWVWRLDPARAMPGRTQLERAVETALLSGVRLGDAHANHRAAPELFAGISPENGVMPKSATDLSPVRYLVIDPGPVLADRIRNRVHAMVDSGWSAEVSALLNSVPATAPAWLASGYDTMRQHVQGDVTANEAILQIVIETRQYAKRQRTWCRHQLKDGPVTRVSSLDPRALDTAIDWWNGAGEVG